MYYHKEGREEEQSVIIDSVRRLLFPLLPQNPRRNKIIVKILKYSLFGKL